jgi:hypothetical protein
VSGAGSLEVAVEQKGKMMITLDELQAELGPWTVHNFGEGPSWHPLLGAVEELGELSRAHLKMDQGIRNMTLDDVGDAIGDILIYLADYCNRQDLHMSLCLQDAWDEVKLRDWRPGALPVHPYDGHPDLKNMANEG